ncbi:nucleotidyltransferase domain-containing protein [Paenibacillus sp. FSL R7-0128]|uniref:nucleotidyltransferase domain-containing protein n=1 Tax=Paenibacillus sp. FSL R7-0128 TaxID=2954529 RepID=UPI0030F729FE
MQREKVQLSLRKVPENIDVYVFGSYIISERPNDVDLIIIYDSNIYSGTNIYNVCLSLLKEIKEKSGLPVDATYLSINEEIETQFVEFVKAISINDVFTHNEE